MTALPGQLALATIADGAQIVASDHRNNYAAIQTPVNAIITALGAGVAGQVLGLSPAATAPVYPPGYPIDYVTPVAGNISVTGTSGAPQTIITGTSLAYDGTAVWVEFGCPEAFPSTTANDFIEIDLYDGATLLGELAVVQNNATGGSSIHAPIHRRFRLTPTAATHQFIVKAFHGSNNGTIVNNTGAGGNPTPAYLAVTKA